MKDESFLLVENESIITVYQDFIKFRKDSFHYILNKLVELKYFENKKDAGQHLKNNFGKFYGKSKEGLIFKDYNWKILVFTNNLLDTCEKETEKEKYVSTFTKVNPKKGCKNYKVLNTPLNFVNLSSLYGI